MNKASQQLNRREFLKQATQAAALALGVTSPRSLLAAAESNASAAIRIGILLGTFGGSTLEARLDAVRACGLDCVQVSLDCAGLSDMPDEIPLEVCGRIRREAAARRITIASVRNILQRPKPRNTPTSPAATTEKTAEKPEARSIPAWYPNHVWSIDTTKVQCWGLWTIQVLVVIDHFSRKVMCVTPREGPNAGWIIEALEQAMRKHGAPKHLISDQAGVFIGDVFAEFLKQWNIKPRLGAVGKHGSIAVTERVIKTLKYEWLRCVPIIKGFDHLASLCTEFESWYNTWRPHMTLEGCRPDDLYYNRKPETPKRDAKTVPSNIERHVFAETRLTAYRLKNAA